MVKETARDEKFVGIVPIEPDWSQALERLGPPPGNAEILIRGGAGWVFGIAPREEILDPRITALGTPPPPGEMALALAREMAWRWFHGFAAFVTSPNSKEHGVTRQSRKLVRYEDVERGFVNQALSLVPGQALRQIAEVTFTPKDIGGKCVKGTQCCANVCQGCDSDCEWTQSPCRPGFAKVPWRGDGRSPRATTRVLGPSPECRDRPYADPGVSVRHRAKGPSRTPGGRAIAFRNRNHTRWSGRSVLSQVESSQRKFCYSLMSIFLLSGALLFNILLIMQNGGIEVGAWHREGTQFNRMIKDLEVRCFCQ